MELRCQLRGNCHFGVSLPTTDAAGYRTSYTYHAASGNVSQILAPNVTGLGRNRTHFVYKQYRAKVKTSSGALVDSTPVWKLFRLRKNFNTPQISETRFFYDASKNLTPNKVIQIAGGIQLTSHPVHDIYGNLVELDGPLSGSDDVAVTFYDKLNRVIGSIGPDTDRTGPILRQASKATYDILGVVTKSETGTATGTSLSALNSMSILESTNSVIDNFGRPKSVYLQVGSAVVSQQDRSYDQRGRVVCTALRMNPTALNGSYSNACAQSGTSSFGPDRISKRLYDNVGRVTHSISAFGTSAESTVLSNYYPHGPIKFIRDGEGNRSYFTYDGFNRSVKTFYPRSDGTTFNSSDYKRYYYDSKGRHYQTRDRDGTVTSWTFDQVGRKLSINAPGTVEDTTLTYDITGAVKTISKPGQTLSYAHDNAGRLTSETSSLGAVSYEYDNFGRRTRMNYPGLGGFYVTYDYTSGGTLTAIKEKGSTALASYTYDSRGRRKTVTRGSSSNVTTYNYDTQSRLLSMNNNLSGSSADQTVSFTYTPSGQIASQTNSNSAFEPTITDYASQYTVNGLNQLTALDNIFGTYDDNGNMTGGGGNTYTYDTSNRLTAVIGKGTLTYDPVSRLNSLTASGATKNFLYDGSDMIAEYSGSTVSKRYVHGPSTDEPLVEYSGSGTTSKTWLVPDVRGSIVTRANSSGTSLATNTYDAYGRPNTANEGRFQYTGQIWFEELGLYYYKARFYDPTMQRFLNADPSGYADGLNMYAYVGGDPVNFSDPTGLYADGINGADVIVVSGIRQRRRQPDFSIDWGAYFNGTTERSGFQNSDYTNGTIKTAQLGGNGAGANGSDRSKVEGRCGSIEGLELDNYSQKQFSKYLEMPGDAAILQKATLLGFVFMNSPRNRTTSMHLGGRTAGDRLRGSDQWSALAGALQAVPEIYRNQMDLMAVMNTQYYHPDAFLGEPRVPNKGDFKRTPEQYEFWNNLQDGCAFNE